MYKLTLETKNPKNFFKINLKHLPDIFQESPQIITPEEKEIRETLKYHFKIGINILQPTKDKTDFIFIYSNKTFWDYFSPNLHEYLLGRGFNQTCASLLKLMNHETSLNTIFYNDQPLDSIIKLYDNKGNLIKVWSQSEINYQGLLYISFADLTEFYKMREEDENIFERASFPKLQINNNYQVVKVNKSFNNFIGYSANELNHLNIDDLIDEYKSNKGVNTFNESLDLLFDKYEKTFTTEIKISTKFNGFKYFDAYSQLISDDTIQIGLHDLTKLKETEQKELSINNYFNNLQKVNRTALSLRYGDKVQWSSEIYDFLEIPEDLDKSFKDNFLYDYIINGDEYKIEKALNELTRDNPTKCVFKVRTGKGNIKYFKSFYQKTIENSKEIILAFTQDVTEEIQTQKESMRLRDNFNLIEESSRIGIAEYYDGEFRFTSQIYEILGANKEDYSKYDDVIGDYLLPEDKENWGNALKLSQKQDVLDTTGRIRNNDNEIRYLYCKNRAIFNDKGDLSKIIGFIMDITEETLAKKSAIDLENNLKHIQKYSKIVIATLINGVYTYTSEIYEILEINPEDYPRDIDLLRNFLLPEDKERIDKEFLNFSPENPSLHLIMKIRTVTGKIKYLEDYVESEFDENGEIVKRVGFIHDITPIILREKEVEELSEERRLLLEEVHDRVKNNLQLILSFINLDSHYNNDNLEHVVSQTKNRIQTMALTHEEVYQSDSLSNVNLESFFEKSVNNLFRLYGKGNIKVDLNIEPIELDMDRAIPLGLLVNEVCLNTIYHAFPDGNEGNFYINLSLGDDDCVVIDMWDDGVGVKDDDLVLNPSTLGFVLIGHLTQQLNGNLTILSDVSGLGLELKFKK